MALDPTLEDMTAFLRQKTAGLLDHSEESTSDDIKIAIHYFATSYHGGMFSNLYQAICQVDYTQNCMELEDEGEDVELCYNLLVKEYAK